MLKLRTGDRQEDLSGPAAVSITSREPISERHIGLLVLATFTVVGLIIAGIQGRDVLPLITLIVGGFVGRYLPE